MDILSSLKKLFKGSPLKITITSDKEQSHFNFAAKDGMNCEFYSCGDTGYLTATYTVNGKEKTFDLHYEDDESELFSLIHQILKPIPKRAKLKLVS